MRTFIEQELNTVEDINSFYETRYTLFFLPVARYIKRHGGTLEDAKDVYHDALIFYYEKQLKPGFVLLGREEAYLMGIVKNLWSSNFKRNIISESLSTDFDFINTEAAIIVNEKRLYTLVVTAGKKCLDLLTMFYQKSTLKNIASSFGFRSEHAVAVQKYKCLEKIREIIKQNSLHHEDFFE